LRTLAATLVVLTVTAATPAEPPSAPPESEGESGLSVQGEARLLSSYFWRGYASSEDLPVLQPCVALEWEGAELSLWTSSTLDTEVVLDEAAVGLWYEHSFGEAWALKLGHQLYGVRGETGWSDATWWGEFAATGSLELDPFYVELTYGRGYGDGIGNSLSLLAQLTVPTAAPEVSLEPYLRADYLDEFSPPAAVLERLSALEAGASLRFSKGSIGLSLNAAVLFLPSAHVRTANLQAGSTDERVRFVGGLVVEFGGEEE